MSASQSDWTLDPTRQAYYRFLNGHYHYADGTIIDRNGRVISAPSNSAPLHRSELQEESDLVDALENTHLHTPASNASTHGHHPHSAGSGGGQDAPTTEPALPASAPRHISGTPGKVETLHSGYKFNPRTFRVGRVFKVLWPEPMGTTTRPQAIVPSNISQVTYGENAYVKIAWFVVVIQRDNWSLCLRIQTYNGQACTKRGVEKREHAIVHTSSRAPDPLTNETNMWPPIRVSVRLPSDKLDPKSRLNLAKLYTVEHNVKVYDFGHVHRDSYQTFLESWRAVLEQMQQSSTVLNSLYEETAQGAASAGDSAIDQAPSGQAMHNTLVEQYAAYLRDEENEQLALALVGGVYKDQVAIYTTLMKKGITPEAPQHDLLVSHYIKVCRNGGQQLKPYRVKLEKGGPETSAEVYAGLISAGYALPTRDGR